MRLYCAADARRSCLVLHRPGVSVVVGGRAGAPCAFRRTSANGCEITYIMGGLAREFGRPLRDHAPRHGGGRGERDAGRPAAVARRTRRRALPGLPGGEGGRRAGARRALPARRARGPDGAPAASSTAPTRSSTSRGGSPASTSRGSRSTCARTRSWRRSAPTSTAPARRHCTATPRVAFPSFRVTGADGTSTGCATAGSRRRCARRRWPPGRGGRAPGVEEALRRFGRDGDGRGRGGLRPSGAAGRGASCGGWRPSGACAPERVLTGELWSVAV